VLDIVAVIIGCSLPCCSWGCSCEGAEDAGAWCCWAWAQLGVWSATNTSPIGTVKFAVDNKPVALQGMWHRAGSDNPAGIGHIICSMAMVAQVAALFTLLTGVMLFAYYSWLIW